MLTYLNKFKSFKVWENSIAQESSRPTFYSLYINYQNEKNRERVIRYKLKYLKLYIYQY